MADTKRFDAAFVGGAYTQLELAIAARRHGPLIEAACALFAGLDRGADAAVADKAAVAVDVVATGRLGALPLLAAAVVVAVVIHEASQAAACLAAERLGGVVAVVVGGADPHATLVFADLAATAVGADGAAAPRVDTIVPIVPVVVIEPRWRGRRVGLAGAGREEPRQQDGGDERVCVSHRQSIDGDRTSHYDICRSH
jgi:hypothetical protein